MVASSMTRHGFAILLSFSSHPLTDLVFDAASMQATEGPERFYPQGKFPTPSTRIYRDTYLGLILADVLLIRAGSVAFNSATKSDRLRLDLTNGSLAKPLPTTPVRSTHHRSATSPAAAATYAAD